MNLSFLKTLLFSVFLLMNLTDGLAQVAINGDGSAPATSAMLDVVSTDKGFLTPRMTKAQRDGILTPAIGLLIFQSDNTPGFYYFNGTIWTFVGITSTQAGAITANTAKAGITSTQAGAITANTAKIGITSTQATAITANTAKVSADGLVTTHSDVSDAGSGKIITATERTSIGTNTAKTGITSTQAAAITANTAKVTNTDDQTLTEVLTSGNSAGSSTINMNSNKITSLATPTADTDAATKKYVDDNGGTGTDDQTLTEVLTSGNSAGSSTINMNSNKITNLATPTADTDAATKKYVDETAVELPNSPTAGTMAYWDGSAWSSIAPGSQDQPLTYCGGVPTWGPCPLPPPEVGDFYEGGVVFHIFVAGETGYVTGETHGLIAAPMDQDDGSGIGWGCTETDIPTVPNVTSGSSGSGAEIGDGATNTADIVAGCMDASFAAKLCADLDLGGYNDWFLPSVLELISMYQNKATIDATAVNNSGSSFSGDGIYWSSTEQSSTLAQGYFFLFGAVVPNDKADGYRVRAVRAF